LRKPARTSWFWSSLTSVTTAALHTAQPESFDSRTTIPSTFASHNTRYHSGASSRARPAKRCSISPGAIDVGDPAYLEACSAALRFCGARAQHLGPTARRDRFPWLNAQEDGCIFSPDTGVIVADVAVRAAATAARAAGARIVEAAPAERFVVQDGTVTIIAGELEFSTRRCIAAAGAWMPALVAPLGITLPVRVTREQVFYFRSDDPVVPFIHRGEIARYGVPALGSASGVKIAEHMTGTATSADDRTFQADPEGAARVVRYVRDVLPSFDPQPIAAETCLYTTTTDEGFIIEERGPIVVVSTCSGHGFKFGPIVGELIAAVVAKRRPPVPIEPFSLVRRPSFP